MTKDALEIYNSMFENDTLWKKVKMLDIDHIELRRKTAKNITNTLLSINPGEFKSKKALYKVELLKELYQALCFFDSDDVRKKFKELGVNDSFLKHFVPFELLLTEIDKIEQSTNTRALRIPALLWIEGVVHAKIYYEMVQWGGYVEITDEGIEKITMERMFENLYRQRKYHKEHGRKEPNDFDSLMHLQLDLIEKIFDDEATSKKIMKQSISGKTITYFLQNLIEECFLHKDYSIPQYFYSACFDLVKLITKHPKMYSLSEFQNLEEGKYYGKSYEWYKNHTVKKMIQQK